MKFPEEFRIEFPPNHPYFSRKGDDYGAFLVSPRNALGRPLLIIASPGDLEVAKGWEHVSVSIFQSDKCPSWQEMCLVKDLFWNEDEVVVQFHPRKSDYVNHHPGCLHLWKNILVEMPTPNSILVGPK